MIAPGLPNSFLRRHRRVHLIGVGGAGMSGIAEVLQTLGFAVSGSDRHASSVTARLQAMGVRVHIGHSADALADADVVVASGAIPADNPELQSARARRLPVIPRAEMLGELMRQRLGIAVAGTHGKTTTTSLLASVLAEAGLDPTYVIGGLLNASGTHARLGSGDYLVAEADESDGSFLLLSPLIAIVTNVDSDHLDRYAGDRRQLQQAFGDFLHRLPFYGVAVLCADDPGTRDLADETVRAVLTYGIEHPADVRASAIRQDRSRMHFDLHLPGATEQWPVQLEMPGRHNVLNALAAAAVGHELGVSGEVIARGLAACGGVGRRFNLRAEQVFGKDVLLFDDYGHHPTELQAIIAAARGGWPERRLVLAFQPHRYSRTRDCLDDFARVLSEVDRLLLTEVYAAGEAPIAGADGRSLSRAVRSRGRVEPVFAEHWQEWPDLLCELLHDGDLLLLAGAGDIAQCLSLLAEDTR